MNGRAEGSGLKIMESRRKEVKPEEYSGGLK